MKIKISILIKKEQKKMTKEEIYQLLEKQLYSKC